MSLQELIDALSAVNIYVHKHIGYGSSKCLCMPVELSEDARRIYAIFKAGYPARPYAADLRGSKAG